MKNHAIEGLENEAYFVKENNKFKDISNPIWSFLSDSLALGSDINNLFLVKVSTQVYSKIHKTKINAKSDAYLVSGNIPSNYLDTLDYLLTEDCIEKFNLNVIKFSGISLKKPDSKHFQILKISPDPFKELFKSYELGAGASVYCKKESEIYKNDLLINGWKSNMNSFKNYFKDIENIGYIDNDDISECEKVKVYKAIKNYSTQKIHDIVINNEKISDAIFKGKGIFDEPYVAHYLLSHGVFCINKAYDFIVTTGSGRSSGKYQLEFKPKKIK